MSFFNVINTSDFKVNIKLLLCMVCLSSTDSFSAFDKRELIRFAEFYTSNFFPPPLSENPTYTTIHIPYQSHLKHFGHPGYPSQFVLKSDTCGAYGDVNVMFWAGT